MSYNENRLPAVLNLFSFFNFSNNYSIMRAAGKIDANENDNTYHTKKGGIPLDKQYNDLIGDMIKENNYSYEKDLPGRGKPLPKEHMQMDTFQHFQKIAKDAGYLPPWLQLQKEIGELIHCAKTEKDIGKINKKIKKYNRICPPLMQKSFVSLDSLEKAKNQWTSE